MPQLVEKSARWDVLTKAVPGFTIEMLRVAELMYKTDWYFTNKLNAVLLEQGLDGVNHVWNAIWKAKSKYTPEVEQIALSAALRQVFQPFVSDVLQTSSAMAQWYTCVSWMNSRNTVGHPLGPQVNRICETILADFKEDVLNEDNHEYDNVRDATLVMVKLAEAMLEDGSAT